MMYAKSWLGLTAAGLVAMFLMTGCTEETPPGGPGAETITEEGEPAYPEATFTLQMPTGATNIEQGASETITIGVDRGEEFHEPVTVTFQPPQGVTIEPLEITLAGDQDEAEVSVRVDDTVQPGELQIPLEGKSGEGAPTSGQFSIEVTEKDEAGADTTPAPGTEPSPATPDVPAPPGGTAPAADDVNPESGNPPTPADENANPANPEAGAPAVTEEEVENAETQNP